MKASALKFLNIPSRNNGKPYVITIDKSGINKEGTKTCNKRNFKNVKWRQCRYLNSQCGTESLQCQKKNHQYLRISRI